MINGLTDHSKRQYYLLFTKNDTLQLPNKSLPPFPILTELHDKSNTYPSDPIFEKEEDNISNTPSPLALYK